MTIVSSLHFVHEARECVGTPYKHQGRLKGVGLDCIGVILWTMKATGCDMMGFQDYPYGPIPTSHFKKSFDQYFEKVWDYEETPKKAWQPLLKNGDLMTLTWSQRPMHCGIVAVGPYGWNLIHSYSGNDKVVEHRIDESWAARVRGIYRIKDVR